MERGKPENPEKNPRNRMRTNKMNLMLITIEVLRVHGSFSQTLSWQHLHSALITFSDKIGHVLHLLPGQPALKL